MRTHRIAVMPMDGIGREVIPAAVRVLRAAEQAIGGFRLETTDFDWSARKSLETGEPIVPPGGFETLRGFDAILFGAHGGTPGVPDDVAFAETLFAFRLAFDEYINLRPCKLLPGIPSLRRPSRRTWISSSCGRPSRANWRGARGRSRRGGERQPEP